MEHVHWSVFVRWDWRALFSFEQILLKVHICSANNNKIKLSFMGHEQLKVTPVERPFEHDFYYLTQNKFLTIQGIISPKHFWTCKTIKWREIADITKGLILNPKSEWLYSEKMASAVIITLLIASTYNDQRTMTQLCLSCCNSYSLIISWFGQK